MSFRSNHGVFPFKLLLEGTVGGLFAEGKFSVNFHFSLQVVLIFY